MIERRSLITGLVAFVAAPAIVKVSSLMKVAPTEVIRPYYVSNVHRNVLFTLNEIDRDIVRMFRDSNVFLANLKRQYEREFAEAGAKMGGTLRIKLPADFVTHNDDALTYGVRTQRPIGLGDPEIPTALGVAALAVAAAPAVEQALQKPVTRRFWS